jgi:hypothetical protein
VLAGLLLLGAAGCAGRESPPGVGAGDAAAAAAAAAAGPPPSVPAPVVQQALEATPSGEALRWREPASGRRGTVTPVRTFRTAQGFCREYAVTLSVPDGTGHAWRDVACRDQAGVWQPAPVGDADA